MHVPVKNLTEGVLNPVTLNSSSFGKLFSHQVDGDIYAQPSTPAGVWINKTVHDVVYVATTHGGVYAFDATNNLEPQRRPALQGASLINPAAGITTVTGAEARYDQLQRVGHRGHAGHRRSVENPLRRRDDQGGAPSRASIQHRLHALDITNGQEKFGGPVTIQGTVPGTGDGGDTVSFSAAKQLQRSALLLNNGVVYVAFASFNSTPYHGWLMAYNAANLQQVGVFCVTPNSRRGSIWMSGGGPRPTLREAFMSPRPTANSTPTPAAWNTATAS